MKQHAFDRRAILAAHLTRDMPRDRFTFAIRVSREQDLARVFRCALEIGESFFLSRDSDVLGLETIFDVDADFLFRQIAHVADRRANAIAAAEVLADRLRFCGRLDDYE